MARLLIIDEALARRIATELKKRGRQACTVAELGYIHFKDPELLRAIAAKYPDAVLVTGDDNMPAAHADLLQETRVTLAIVSPEREPGYSSDQWEHEIVHRWIHRMEAQEIGSIKRYTLNGVRMWRPRRRP